MEAPWETISRRPIACHGERELNNLGAKDDACRYPRSTMTMKSKLHITIALVRYASVAIVALASAFVAIDQRDPIVFFGHGMYDHHVYTFGWPVVAGSHQISEPMITSPVDRMES